MTQPRINPHGAIDLSSLAPRPSAASASATPASGAAALLVVDVNESEFEAVVMTRSMTVPVVIDFWADWCGPCKQLSPILEKLAVADEGRWMLAKVDVDANPGLGSAFQVQSIPAVFAVIGGQLLPLFQGALPEAQVRRYLDELLRVAAENGVAGRLAVTAQDDLPTSDEPAHDPRYDEAFDAIERGDLDTAVVAYRALLDQAPGDVEAKAGLAQVELLRRTQHLDVSAVLQEAVARPDDVLAQVAAADVELVRNLVEEAFSRLVELVRRSRGEDRERAREHLVGLFEVLGAADPRVAKARLALANALY